MTGQEQEQKPNLPIISVQKWDPEKIDNGNLTLLVFGESGVGKTVFSSSWPEPLLIDIDRGIKSVQLPIDYVNVDSWQDLKNIYANLKFGEHPYQTVVLDTLNGIQDITLSTVLEEYPGVNRYYEGIPTMGDYQKALVDFYNLVSAFTLLPINVVLVARAGIRAHETDFIKPHFVGKATASQITALCDVIGYMDRREVENKETKEKKRLPAIHFNELMHVSKDRTWQLPAYIIAPTYDKLAAYWK